MDIIIVQLLDEVFEHVINAVMLKINLLLDIGRVKTYGLEVAVHKDVHRIVAVNDHHNVSHDVNLVDDHKVGHEDVSHEDVNHVDDHEVSHEDVNLVDDHVDASQDVNHVDDHVVDHEEVKKYLDDNKSNAKYTNK